MSQILVVDDDPFLLEWYSTVLTAAGHSVRTYPGPEEALAALSQAPVDVVITDLMMSEMDSGFTLARQIRSNPELAHIKVIIITAIKGRFGMSFSPRDDEELRTLGADAFFEKPVKPEQLIDKIRHLLRPQASPTSSEQT